MFCVGPAYDGLLGECCFGVMYYEWYGVYDFVVLSVVEGCAVYGCVNMFQVCLNFVVAMVLGSGSMFVV